MKTADNINHSSYVTSVAPARGGCPCSRGGGGCQCSQPVDGVGDTLKDNAWVIAAGASVVFLGLALLRRKK